MSNPNYHSATSLIVNGAVIPLPSTSPADDEVLGFDSGTGSFVWDVNAGGGGGSDHGALTGLADDDHSQYHNDARGDARYYTQAALDAFHGTAAAIDVGTGANEIVQLDGSAKLPAVDGSALTNLPSSGALTDVLKSAAANNVAAEFGEHTTVEVAAESDTVTLAAAGAVGTRGQVYNRTANELVLAKDAGDSYSGTVSTVIPRYSGFEFRVVEANVIEVVGTGATVDGGRVTTTNYASLVTISEAVEGERTIDPKLTKTSISPALDAAIDWDLDSGTFFHLTVNGDHTFNFPSNPPAAGEARTVIFRVSKTASTDTLTLAAAWEGAADLGDGTDDLIMAIFVENADGVVRVC